MFCQVFAGLFERDVKLKQSYLQLFKWDDDMLLDFFTGFCEYIRLVDAINRSKSTTYYWMLFYFVILLIYLHQSLKYPKFYFESVIQLLRVLLLLSNAVLFMPFYEIFISVFRCEQNGHHYLIQSMQCYQTEHAVISLISLVCLITFISLNAIIALLYNETQPVKEDALSRLDSNFEIIMLVYRILVGTLSQFCISGYCSWIIIAVSLISSVYFLYSYFKFIPYYNNFVSIFFGSMIGVYCWISVNALLSQFYSISGHIIVIFVGIPIVCLLVKSTREIRIEALMTSTTEKMNNDIDSLNQITMIQEWLRESGKNSDIDKEMRIKGLINLHIYECSNDDCICKNIDELYDHQNDKYLNSQVILDLHKNQVFVNHFNKQLYSEALNKFINSPSIHISYAFYQFSAMRNIHAALHELKIASKKRPTIQQRFTIFRYQHIIELFIKKESDKLKHIYEQLTNVKEFERLFQDMSKQIEKVCNFQVEFWTHLTTIVPDLNFLNDLNVKIYNASQQADQLWRSLCQINSNYPQALNLYGEYLTFIRNNQQAGKEYFDKAHNVDFAQKSVQDNVKRSDILFTEDSTVVHISGNKESSGRILKISQGLYKCFGLSKQEVIGHNVSNLMPNLFADKHSDFLDSYYKTGRQNIFNKERQLFALNRQGYCFTMKLLIKQMPSLKEDMQYVGMIKPISTDYEYILTDMSGNIDSFTSGIGSMLSLNPQHFKETLNINIQMLAPELITIFEYRRAPPNQRDGNNDASYVEANYRNYYRRPSFTTFQFGQSKFLSNNKYSVPGGDALTFVVPNNFAQLIKSEKPTKSNRTTGAATKKKSHQGAQLDDTSSIQHGGSSIPSQNQANKYLKSTPFREFMKYLSKGRTYAKKAPDIKKLLGCKEYRDCDVKKSVSIEIREWAIPMGNNDDRGLKLLLFMVAKNQSEKRQQELQSFDGNNAPGMMAQQQQNDTMMLGNTNNNSIMQIDNNMGMLGQSQNNIALENMMSQQQQLQQQQLSKGGGPKRIGSNNISQYLQDKQKQNKNNPMSQQFQSSGLSSKIQQQFKTVQQPVQHTNNTAQIQQSMSFLDLEQQQQQQQIQPTSMDPLTPIREESVFPDSPDPKRPALKPKHISTPKNKNKGKANNNSKFNPQSKKVNQTDSDKKKASKNPSDYDDDLPSVEADVIMQAFLDLQKPFVESDDDVNKKAKMNKEDVMNGLGNDDDDTEGVDNEAEIVTDRIDVKKEIILNDEIKQNTKNFEESNKMQSNNSLPKIGDSKKLTGQNNNTGRGTVNNSQRKEEKKNQLKNKPTMEKISQSKDDDEVGEFQGDQEDGEGSEDDYDYWGSSEGDEDGYDDDEDEEDAADMEDDAKYRNGSFDGSDEEQLIPDGRRQNKGDNKKRPGAIRSGGNTPSGKNNSLMMIKGPSMNNGWTGEDPSDPHSNHPSGQVTLANANGAQLAEKKQKLHDYTRIVTNPRYKYFDDETCGSAYFNDCNCSERELDIRDMIKKNETTKKRRDRRRKQRKEEENKKQAVDREIIKQDSIPDQTQKLLQTGNDTEEQKLKDKDEKTKKEETVRRFGGGNVVKRRRKEDESESKSKSKGRSESSGNSDEDKKNREDEEDEENDEQQRQLDRDMEQPNDEGEVSSIASSQQSQARTFFTLRAAIDEKYIPLQIKNLRFVANLVWALILLLAIVYYVIQYTLFTDIQEYIEIIINSEKRVNDIMDMNLKLNDIILLNEDYLDAQNYPFPQKQQLLQTYIADFLNSTTELKNSQTQLSLQTADLGEQSRKRINPEDVILQYERVSDLPYQYSYNIWEAIIQIVVYAYKLAETPLEIVHSHPSVQFIVQNCMNSVMSALQESTNAIIDESDSARETNINIFMYLLIAVSCALILSMAFLLPVIRKARYNKQEVFELFTHRKVEKCIDDQLKKCRWFIQKYQAQAENQNFEAELQDNMIEENTHIPEKEMKADDDKQSEYMKNYKKQKKKWKQININFGMLIIKFVCFLLLIEGFFLFNYFISKQFLYEVSLLTKELRLLISRQPSLSNIILMEKELFYSNNSAQFLFRPVKDVLDQAYQTQYQDYQELLTSFSLNYDYHTDKYNNDFNNIIYSNLCDQIAFTIPYVTQDSKSDTLHISQSDCNNFNGGILQKGIYNSVVKYWTQLQQLHNDFFGSERSITDIKQFLNHQKLLLSELMSERYFEASHWHLVWILKEDIDNFFSDEFKLYQAVFILFLLYILLIYFFVWRIFMKNLMEELWKAKSVLRYFYLIKQNFSVMPVEVCFRIEEIRNFIYKNSSTFIGASG